MHPLTSDVVLDLPIYKADSCAPLKVNVYGVKLAGHILPVNTPKATSITVPADATSLYINCEQVVERPKSCGPADFVEFINAQEFLVDLHGAPRYELQCRITTPSTDTHASRIEVLITQPYQGQLQPARPF